MNYTPYDLAKLSNLSRSHVYKLMRDWKIEATLGAIDGSAAYLIPEEEAQRFLRLARKIIERMEGRNVRPTEISSREELAASQFHRHYHGNSWTTMRQWNNILLNDKYLRKPITPASRMARIFQIVERMKQREAA